MKRTHSTPQTRTTPRRVWIPALVFTSLLILFLIAAFFLTPTMTRNQQDLVRFLFALLAGFATLFLGGTALLQFGIPKNPALKLSLSATAGVAIFVFVYVYPPYWYNTQEVIQQGEGSLVLSSLKIQDKGPGLSLVDVIIRNTGPADSVIHKAEFVVLKVEPVPLGGHPYYLPSTHQYNAIMTPTDKGVALDLTQVVPAKGADRFQIILALGTERAEKTPWGSASIGWIIDPKTDTKLTHLNTKMVLCLRYDENKTLESSPFEFAVYAPGFGFKADKIAGFKLEDKISLLSDKDINVVESLVESLGSIGGSEALQALRALRSRELGYLQEYYAREVYGKVENPTFWDLPPPEIRFASFMETLDKVIKHLETSK